MSNLSLQKTKVSGKTISAVLAELLILIGSFVLFSSKFNLASLGGATLLIVFGYPFVVSISTGIVAATIAETKHLMVLKWGALVAAMTLFIIILLVTLPSFVSAFAFLIAPVVAIAIFLNLMAVREASQPQ